MKKLFLLIALIRFTAAAYAQDVASGTTGACTWTLTGPAGDYTLTISGTGAMGDCLFDTPWDAYRADIRTLTLEPGITTIGQMAFARCSSLTSVTLPAGVTRIGQEAFRQCSSLTSVTLPASVTSIGGNVFAWCPSLTSITVADGNTSFVSIHDVLFNYDQTMLLQYPAGKSGAYAIPAGVTRIGLSAFLACSGLTSVTLPAGVTRIGQEAFAWCGNLILTVEWATPLSVEGPVFTNDVSKATLHVPVGTKALYEAADAWKEFGTILDDVTTATDVVGAGSAVWYHGGLLHVDTPQREGVTVYSTTGQTLYRVQKAAGVAVFDLHGLPRGVLIVRCDSGRAQKIVR
jgi:hypothetical protein